MCAGRETAGGLSGGATVITTLWLCSSLLAASQDGGTPVPPTSTAWKEYEAARDGAGGDAEAQVKLALWCESHGLSAERTKHLALAILRDPSHATARGLLGVMAHRGKWRSPEEVARRVK